MSEIHVYKWEDIRKYFPPERVAEIRAKVLELRKSGKYTDRELWEMHGMSERTFYYLVERAKDGSTAEDLKDRPSKPKNPYRKLTFHVHRPSAVTLNETPVEFHISTGLCQKI